MTEENKKSEGTTLAQRFQAAKDGVVDFIDFASGAKGRRQIAEAQELLAAYKATAAVVNQTTAIIKDTTQVITQTAVANQQALQAVEESNCKAAIQLHESGSKIDVPSFCGNKQASKTSAVR
jgi:hypothetical protein